MRFHMKLTALALLYLSADAYSQQTVQELLARYDLAQKAAQAKYVKAETTRVDRDSHWNQDRWFVNRSDLYVDGDRMDLSSTGWVKVRDNEDRELRPEERVQTIWDSATWYEYHEGPTIGLSRVYVSEDQERRTEYFAVGYAGAPVEGWFPGDLVTVSSVFHEADNVTLHDGTENVRGTPCYVLETATTNGTHRIWIDPEHGYNICQAEVVKGEHDLCYDHPVSRPYPNWSELGVEQRPGEPPLLTGRRVQVAFTMKNVRFEQTQDAWIPVAADWEMKTTHADDRIVTQSFHYQAIATDLSPDFDTARAFVPNVRNGTRVSVEGENPVITRHWMNGRVEFDIDKELQKTIDTTIKSLSAELDTEKAPPSLEVNRIVREIAGGTKAGTGRHALSQVVEPRRSNLLRKLLLVLGCGIGLGLAGAVSVSLRRRRRYG